MGKQTIGFNVVTECLEGFFIAGCLPLEQFVGVDLEERCLTGCCNVTSGPLKQSYCQKTSSIGLLSFILKIRGNVVE